MRKQVLVAIAVLGLGGTLALAEDGRPVRARRGLVRELNLSEQQSGELARLRSAGRKDAIRRRADVAIARQELRELLTAPQLDEKAVSAQVKKLSALQAERTQARAEGLLAMRRILTPEQLETLASLPPRRPHRSRRRPSADALTVPEGE
jgi:Spy/CpxP family protein refolding chaperone